MDNSKNLMNNDKSLCLYCDKAFSSISDQENHVERDHKTILNKGKGSRKSERITKNLSLENSPFPGCFYCNNSKYLKSDDLESLFQHLLTVHKDVYFGCKCKKRMSDRPSFTNHKKNCKIGGGKEYRSVDSEKVTEKRKAAKKPQKSALNESKCDSLSESDERSHSSATAANHHHSVKTLPTNAIHKKSDRSNLKNLHKNASYNDRRKSKMSSSSSTISSCSSSKASVASDEYTIPLTRQKLKEPTAAKQQNSQTRSLSNKKVPKVSKIASAVESNNNNNGSSSKSVSSASSSSTTKVQRTKTVKVINHNSQNNSDMSESTQKNEIVNAEFDEDFYKNISHNVRTNLNCYIDGKIDRLENRPVFDRISASENHNRQPQHHEPGKAGDIASHEKEIHESTNFELSTPFPALLTVEQYGFGDSNPNKNKRQITKNSWKWKWDLIKKYKYVNEGGKIVKKVKQITTGLKDLSQLDMWTQLSMRSRYENLNRENVATEFDDGLNDSLSTRMIKTQNIEQLNCILDKRLTPEINIEQLQQTVIKQEFVEPEEVDKSFKTQEDVDDEDTCSIDPSVLSMLRLSKTSSKKISNSTLSGEWARPRCFVCIDCGQEFDLMKSLTDHKNSEHPYVVSAHYEIVGRENLEQKLYRNLFLPKKALQSNGTGKSINSICSDSKSTEISNSSDNSSKFQLDQKEKEKECSKCLKMIKYSSDIDIYRHILDCIEDRVWMQAKRRNKYRRSRRKGKKNVKKPRLSVDQKKSVSSPIVKENAEGDTSSLSISNPPTPKEEKKVTNVSAKSKGENYINDHSSTNESMNIKSFFRVSKTTPHLPQKIVVQMLEMPTNANHNSSLRHSLRSSTKKASPNKPCDENSPKANSKTEAINVKSAPAAKEVTITEVAKSERDDTKKPLPEIKVDEKQASQEAAVLTSLHISEPDKNNTNKSLCSPNSAPLASPTSNLSSLVPKKKKKLNDCIAMLTCKIQEKLGVNFFENATSEIIPLEKPVKEDEKPVKAPFSVLASTFCSPILSPEPKIVHAVPQKDFAVPVQDEVIDLSVKKKTEDGEKEIVVSQIIAKNEVKEVEKPTPATTEESVILPVIVKHDEKPVEILKEKNSSAIPEEKELTPDVQPNVINVESQTPLKEENTEPTPEVSKDSYKVSIPKELIPNLDEILNNKNVITVNNLTISESERRAFEEQKNRIRQILQSKTKQLNVAEKKAAKKASAKKTTPKKASKSAKQNEPVEVKQLYEFPKIKEPTPTPEPIEPVVNIENKIAEVIKTTNRIRCRRLSVVVDPIVNMSAFQKNRKIRLTNNSQQNGFYDLLTNDQLFNVLKPELKSTRTSVDKKATSLIQEAIKEVCALTTGSSKEVLKSNSNIKGKSAPVTKAAKAKTSKSKKKAPAKQTSKRIASQRLSIKENQTLGNSKTKDVPKESVKNKATPVVAKKESFKKDAEPPAQEQPKTKAVVSKNVKLPVVKCEPKKSVKKTKNSKATKPDEKVEETSTEVTVTEDISKEPLKEIEPSSDAAKVNETSPADISFSSDTSNENDIPLARLISANKVPVVELVQHVQEKIVPKVTPKRTPKKSKSKKAAKSSKAQKKNEKLIEEKEMPKADDIIQEVVSQCTEKPLEIVAIENLVEEKEIISEIPEKEVAGGKKNKKSVTKKTKVDNKKSQEPSAEQKGVDEKQKVEELLTALNTKEENIIAVEPQLVVTEISEEPKTDVTTENETKTEQIIVEEEEKVKPNKERDQTNNKKQKKVNSKKQSKKEQKVAEKLSVINEQENDENAKVTKELSQKEEKSDKSKEEEKALSRFDSFTINEDSFFNDDNEIDQANDKINDIVNNIINSSEFIDSENEKSELVKEDEKGIECLICNKTFRNVKVLEKHLKTNTHLLKEKRQEKRIVESKERELDKSSSDTVKVLDSQAKVITDETKIFRTKGALKTFDHILTVPSNGVNEIKSVESAKEFIPIENAAVESKPLQIEDDDEEELLTKDKIFDSLFTNIENKIHASVNNTQPPKYDFPTLTPHDSEIESSSTSWDLKHDADIEWDGDNDNIPFPSILKDKYSKKFSAKINKSKDTAVSIPTKSLIMGKIFKKHRDREKQKTPQADAPNNKPGIKNSLDEIFDHLKNSSEIDDKVLTCPSPKTLLKVSGGTFSPHSSNSNDMLETASQSNNNNSNSNNNNNNNNNIVYAKKTAMYTSTPEKQTATQNSNSKSKKELDEIAFNDDMLNEEQEDGIGKRKPRRRCAIKTKTFAETWSSDEYEELHDTNDIISIINEIEKRESNKKRKVSKCESHPDINVSGKMKIESSDNSLIEDHFPKAPSILKFTDVSTDKKSHQSERCEKKKSVQLQFPPKEIFKEKPINTIKKRRVSTLKDGHKSDEETFTATKDLKPLKPTLSSLKKRRMSCFVPSSTFDVPSKPAVKQTREILKKCDTKDESESLRCQKKLFVTPCNVASTSTASSSKKEKKAQKHRKRPRNKVKNIAYDSDSDFELNLSKKSKASTFSDSYSEEEDEKHVIVSNKNHASQNALTNKIQISSNTNELTTMTKEPKLLPNDLNAVQSTAIAKAAIPEDIIDPLQSACNRTKRHSSEKLYYWSSSSSDSEPEHGDTADGENEDSMVPQQPEQHGWIVGDSHKKLVTLLAHAKIKNKIN